MELLENSPWVKHKLPFTIEEAVANALAPDGCGYIELAMNHGVKCADMLGKLVQHLHSEQIINDDFVLYLLPGFEEYKGAPDDDH
jgi:hypothetical protein